MALKKCGECGHEISKKAKQCPSCGAPQGPKEHSLGKLIVIALFVWFIFSLLDTGPPKKTSPPPSRNISSSSFPEPWPFSVREGTVACDSQGAITFSVGMKTYGINGIAKTDGHPAPDEIWNLVPDYERKVTEYAEGLNLSKEKARKKMGPIKVSIQPILDAGLKLCR